MVERWTRKLDIIDYDVLLFQIHSEVSHWSLGVMDFDIEQITELDPMGSGGPTDILQGIYSWFLDECIANKYALENNWEM